jgi:ferredoxin
MRDSGLVRINVRVNSQTCMANQMCVRIAPDIFRLGDGGFSEAVREVDESDLDALRAAEEGCPTASIQIEVLDTHSN